MINGKTFYQILGVLPDAEDIVIRAAYRSLSQKYHPDKWKDDPKFANERMAELNRAYEVLSETRTREAYDEELRTSNKGSDFNSSSPQEDEFQEFYKQSDKDWNLAKNYFPKIDQFFVSLKKINYGLAFAYRQTILEKKLFSDAEKVYVALKLNFLKRYFGGNQKIQDFAEFLIQNNQKDAALELNQVVQVLGDSVDPNIIIKKINEKFPFGRIKTPEIEESVKKLQRFKSDLHYYKSPSDAIKAIAFLGGMVKSDGIILNNKFSVALNGVNYDLSKNEFVDFAYQRVSDELNRYSS